MEIKDLKKINWKQPKYMLPAILYLPLLLAAYLIIDIFHTEVAEIPDDSMQTTEYLNPELPEAKMKGDGIGGKYESMLKSYGKIDDFSAVDNIDRNQEELKEEYNSQYSDEELAQMQSDSLSRMAEMQKRLSESARRGQEINQGEANLASDSEKQQKEAMEELNRALAQIRLQGQTSISPTGAEPSEDKEEKIEVNEKAVKTPSSNEDVQEVVKKVKVTSDYFNTICENDKEQNLIKAIIDENIKAVDGSRVRLRLLDEIEINEVIVPKGAYIYAIMSGFGSQRVKGNVKSIMVEDNIIKVNLSLYDTDGLEGLYVPGSSFRETTKDVGSGALNNTSALTSSTTTSSNSLASWGTQAASNAIQKTSNAISKAIRKNSAKLKYGTFVYLINSRENNKNN